MDEQPELRRALFRGYRRPDVELALARATIARERVQLELEVTSARANDLEREVEDLRSQIADHRRRETELLAALDEVRDRRESLEREARLKADEILNEARERASGLRTDRLKEVGELQEQVEQLLGLRTGLSATLKRTMQEVGGVLERLAGNAKSQAKTDPGRATIEPPHLPEDLGAALSPFSSEPDDL
jgi:cell division septum initiation protein DivIVA